MFTSRTFFARLLSVPVLYLASLAAAQAPGAKVKWVSLAKPAALSDLVFSPEDYADKRDAKNDIDQMYVVDVAIHADNSNLQKMDDAPDEYSFNVFDPSKEKLGWPVCRIVDAACKDKLCFLLEKQLAKQLQAEYGKSPGRTKVVVFISRDSYKLTERHAVPYYAAVVMAFQKFDGTWVE